MGTIRLSRTQSDLIRRSLALSGVLSMSDLRELFRRGSQTRRSTDQRFPGDGPHSTIVGTAVDAVRSLGYQSLKGWGRNW